MVSRENEFSEYIYFGITIILHIYLIIGKMAETDFSRIENKIIAIFLRCCHDSSKVFTSFHWPYLPILLYHSMPSSSPVMDLMQLWEESKHCSWLPIPQSGWASKHAAFWSVRKQCNISILLKSGRWSLITQNGPFGHTISTVFTQTTCLFHSSCS